MAFVTRKLTAGRLERRRRLCVILPEVLESLEEIRKNPALTGKEIKEIDAALRGVASFLSRLQTHTTTHDCNLSTVVGSTAIGNMYQAMFGKKDLSSFLEKDYFLSEEAFHSKEMEVPLVLREIYKWYKRFDAPVDDQEMREAHPPSPSPVSDC